MPQLGGISLLKNQASYAQILCQELGLHIFSIVRSALLRAEHLSLIN